MKSYSNDLRERIVARREEGYSAAEVAKVYKVSKRSVERYWKRYISEATIKPKQRGGYRISRLAPYDEQLCLWIKQDPSITLSEICTKLELELGIRIGMTALWHRLKNLGLSYKKNSTRHRTGSC